MTVLQSIPSWQIALVLFILVILVYLGGYQMRKRAIRKKSEESPPQLKTINGMVLALLGLLLAFTFSMSNARYDTRRSLLVEESNAIGTTILRTDIYPDSVRNLLRTTLKAYLEERILFYNVGMDYPLMVKHYRNSEALSAKVWHIAATYAKTDNTTTVSSQLIPAINAMIDIATTRRSAGEGTIPESIMYFLFSLCCCTSFLIGYDHSGKLDWIIILGFSFILSATVFYIIDLDRPRSGFVNMDKPHNIMLELRGMFKEDSQ